MMGSLFILTALISAPIHPEYTEAAEVFGCDFSADEDRNFDNWPDHWTRWTAPEYPFYVRMEIEDDTDQTSTQSNRCLAVRMDGGGAALQYKETPVAKTFSYIVACSIRTKGLDGHAAYVRLTALNSKQEVVEKLESTRLHDTQPWTLVEIGPWAPASDDIASIVISLHVEPSQPGALFGEAYFDNVWLARLPRITLSTDKTFNLYTAPHEQPRVRCGVSGISNATPAITFELFDAHGRLVSSQQVPLAAKRMSGVGTGTLNSLPAYAGEANWAPQVQQVGFYTIRATVDKDKSSPLERTLTMALVNDLPAPPSGIFGWCLPRGEENLPVRQLALLVSQSGVNWVKFPVWFSDEDTEKADRIAWFAERLSNAGIQLVAILTTPPAFATPDALTQSEGSAIALVISEAEVWQKLLNPVMTRLSLKVRWWQIGTDHDASFVGFTQLGQRIREIRDHFERFGQEVRLGVAWNWLDERPAGSDTPWSFLSYFSNPPLTARELETYIKDERQQGRPAWVVLDPLTTEHDLETRARDLVLRMVAAKTAGADAAFVSDPFDAKTGLLNPDGTPRELFLPWRTAAMLLANSEYLGEWQLPSGSHNRVFAQGNQAIIVIWNDKPAEERLFIGDPERVKQIDVWGKVLPIERDGDKRPQQVIHVQTLPTFIIGANLPISRMRIDFAFDKQELSSTFGTEQTATLHFHNYFPQGVSGEINLRTPDVWTVLPERIRFKSALDEQQTQAFRIFLGNNAPSGQQPVHVDFDINADRLYQFSIYRTIRVGSNEIDFEIIPSLHEGSLIIEQHLINRSDQEVSFNCMLFVPGVGRERRQVLHATRGRRSDQYVIPGGESLIGTTLWLRAEEIGGAGRLLNYHVKIEN